MSSLLFFSKYDQILTPNCKFLFENIEPHMIINFNHHDRDDWSRNVKKKIYFNKENYKLNKINVFIVFYRISSLLMHFFEHFTCIFR